MMNLPEYYLLSGRPVKVVRMEDGRVGTYGFKLQTGQFEISPTLLNRVTKADNENAVRVSEEEFLARAEELRKGIASKKSGSHKEELE